MPVSAEEGLYEVSNFDEFKMAVEAINASTTDGPFTISLTNDINFGSDGYESEFNKNTTILGNGHTIELGDVFSNAQISVDQDATLSLGKSDGTADENKLKITTSAPYKSQALIRIGRSDVGGTLNMYEGVEVCGNNSNGASNGSAINLVRGVFNMYGGDIHDNTIKAGAYMGGAVANSPYTSPTTFNMYGGSIRDNTTLSIDLSKGGGVFLVNSTFNMYGGSIKDNALDWQGKNDLTPYGGGVFLLNTNALLSGGEITGNINAYFGGGLYVGGVSEVQIKSGFRITDNYGMNGGGICSTSENIMIEEGAIIANNEAYWNGDDISNYGTITLPSALSMNTNLTTDDSNHLITDWYLDNEPRWNANNEHLVLNLTNPITEKIFLKAAYENPYKVAYSFESLTTGKDLPNSVNDLLPVDIQEYQFGDKATALQPIQLKVDVTDGIWEFKGFDADEKEIDSRSVEFVGTWEFTYKPYNVNYRFESGTTGKDLPNTVNDLLPVDTKEYLLGDKATAVQPSQLKVDVADGTWEFKGYDADEKEIDSRSVEFTGTWKFTPKQTTTTKKEQVGGWDDGGPFTTDKCGNVFDRWGNKIYEANGCNVGGYNLVRTSVID